MKTFVIRLFVETDDGFRAEGVHGVVEDVAGGTKATFGDGDELLAFLRRASFPELEGRIVEGRS